MASIPEIVDGDIRFDNKGQLELVSGLSLLKQDIREYILDRVNLDKDVIGMVGSDIDDVIEMFIHLRLEIVLIQLKRDLEDIKVIRRDNEKIGKIGLILVKRNSKDPTKFNFFIQFYTKQFDEIELREVI